MRCYVKSGWACATAAVTLPLACGLLHAAEEQTTDVALEEIVVTAEHRSESVQNTALAITALDAEGLARAGVTQTADLANVVPGLQIAQGPNAQVYLRGVGTLAANSYAEPAIAVNLDGVYIARPTAMDNFFFDLQRVEVLKGPQGTLYGRNSVGGAINIISARPTEKLEGYVDLEGGNFDRVRTAGALNLPLNDQWRVRAAFQTMKHDGYLSDGYDDQDAAAGRIRLLYEPSADVSLLLSGDYAHVGGRGTGSVLAPFINSDDAWIGPTDARTAALRQQLNNGAAFPTNSVNTYVGRGLPPVPDNGHQDTTNWGTSADLEWTLGSATWSTIAAYRHPHANYTTMIQQYPIIIDERSQQRSLETRLASNGESRLKWLGGLYYFTESEAVSQDTNQFTNYSTQDYTLDNESYAAFGQATFAITSPLRFTLGARYTRESKTLSGTRGTAKPVAPPPACPAGSVYTPGTFPVCLFPVQGDLDFNSTNYRAGLEFDVTQRSMAYLNYSTGFKAGGFYAGLPPNTFRPEKLKAYALGSKNRFFDERVQLNAEAYYWDYRDHQESFFGPIQPSGFGFITGNVGKQTMKGVDLDVQWLATADDLLSLQALFLDSRYHDLKYTIAALSTTSCPATGAMVGAFPVIDCSGRSVMRAPRWSVNADYAHTFRLSQGAALRAHIGSHYQTETSVAFNFRPPADVQRAYHVSQADVTFLSASGFWSLSGWVRNIEDEAVAVSAQFPPGTSAASPGGAVYAVNVLQAPRTYGATLSVHF